MRRSITVIIAALGSLSLLTACPGRPQMPSGPAPEYEDPPPPSWLNDAGTEPSAPAPEPPSAPPSEPADGGIPST